MSPLAKKQRKAEKVEAEARLTGGLAPTAPKASATEAEAAWAAVDKDPLSFLLAPKELSTFIANDWEKHPVHISANTGRHAVFDGLFDINTLLTLATQRESDEELGPMEFGVDFNAARYEDGKRTTPNGEVGDVATLRTLFAERCTFQVIQPQRYHDLLWRMLAALEAQVGCLMGCNAYLTPKGTQGLAPHHDDVEIFVCQTQGSKRWRLYAPLDGHALPNMPSGDLPEEVIGEPILDVTLQVGDVLYMPRGTIHQATAQSSGDSAHLTISTYQHWTWGSLAQHVMRAATAVQGGGGGLPLALRQGLPIGYPFNHGLLSDLLSGPTDPNPTTVSAAARLAAGLRALADQLEEPKEGPAMVTVATDSLAADFIRARLPPYPTQLPDKGEPPLGPGDGLIVRGKGLFMLVPVEGPEDPEVPEGYIKLTTCLDNDRATHMMAISKDHDHDGFSSEEDDDEIGDGEEAEDGGEGQVHRQTLKEKHGKPHVHSAACCHPNGHCSSKGNSKKAASNGVAAAAGAAQNAAADTQQHALDGTKHLPKQELGGTGKADAKGTADGSDDGDDSEGGEGEEGSDSDDEMQDGWPSQVEELPGPVFPAAYAVTLSNILSTTDAAGAVPVSELDVPGADEEEQLRLAYTLWSCGFVCTVPGKAADLKAAKKGKAGAKKQGKNENSKGAKQDMQHQGNGKEGKKQREGKEQVAGDSKAGKRKA